MPNYRDTSLQIRLASITILGLFIALAAASYFNGQQVQRSSDLITTDAVPGTIAAHNMRLAMSRSFGWAMVAASAQTAQSREADLKTVHEAEQSFDEAVVQYQPTIIINPVRDHKLFQTVISEYAKYHDRLSAYEALIRAGNRGKSDAFLENQLVPTYVTAIQSAEDLLDYNHNNSITYAKSIRESVHRLYWAETVVIALALICSVVLAANFAVRRQEVRKLRESEEKYSKAFRSNPVGITISKMETGEFVEVNESYCRIAGYPPEDMIGSTPAELGIMNRAAYRQQLYQPLVADNALRDVELQIRPGNGGSKTVLVNAERIQLGGVQCLVSLTHDITERKRSEERIHRLNRTYAMLSGVNQTIVHEKDGRKMMGAICDIAVKLGNFRTAWIGLLDPTAKRLQPVASSGFVDGYVENLNIDLQDKNRGSGPAATSLLSGEHVLCHDIDRDPLMAPWRSDALLRGYKSLVCFPLKVNGESVGVFCLYAGESHFFDDEELRLLDELAEDIGFALEVEKIESDRKRTQEELKWNTAFLEAQVASSSDGILVVNEQRRRILQNDQLFQIFKVPPAIADREDDEVLLAHTTSKIKNPNGFLERVEYLYAHPDESSREEIELRDGTVLDRYSAPVRGKSGTYYGRIWTFRDITERKRAEARFRRLVDSNAQGVLFWNVRGEITGANDAFLNLTGYTRDELRAGLLNWVEMTPPEYAEVDRRSIEEVVAKGVCAPFEKEFICKNNARVPVLIGSAIFEDNPDEGVCFVLDLSERKKLEQQFLRAQRMESIGTLAGGIAHDLNNVLAPIMMAIAILEMREEDRSKKEILATISNSAQRGADMVRQVLSFARGVEGRRMEIQVKHLLKEIEKIANDTFLKTIKVRTQIPNGLHPIEGDPTQLHQVLLNLCVNARDAMPDGGTLTLSAENFQIDQHFAALNPEAKMGSYVLIKVEDTGTGIPAEVMEKIFDPFFTTKELGKGTGLGLSTTLGIVKSHRGFIRVYSEVVKGTKFQVYIPAKTEMSPESLKQIEAEMPRGNGELVLVVDDEASVRQITQGALEAYGYRVVLASEGREAVGVYQAMRHEVDVVLIDMMMPVLDGPGAIFEIMNLNPRAKIIGASGLSSSGHFSRATSMGVKHFLPKPYTAETLLKELKKVLEEAS